MGKLVMPDPTATFTLSNGIPVTVYDDPRTPEVCRVTVVMDGGIAESPQPAMAKFMTDRLIDGCGGMTPEQLAETIDYNGVWMGFDTQTHHRLVSMSLLNRRAEAMMPVLADMIFAPGFDSHTLEVEKQKFIHTLEVDRHKVAWQAASLGRRMMYGADSAMGAEVDPSQFATLTREQLLALHSRWLVKGAVRLYVAGRVTEPVVQAVAEAFGSRLLPEGPGAVTEPVVAAPVAAGTREYHDMADAMQTGIVAFIPTPGRISTDYNALRTLGVLLGGYFGSRLNANIREDKGYTYGIGAALIGYKTAGWLRISCEADNRYAAGVIEEITHELNRLGDPASYSADELERVKAHVMLSLAAQLDSPFEVMDYHIRTVTVQTGPDYFNAQQRAVNAMTPEFMAGLARRYFNPSELRYALAGAPRQ